MKFYSANQKIMGNWKYFKEMFLNQSEVFYYLSVILL